MEDLTFEDQIKVFRESELITGPHGAAFSFGIFCEPGAILYEIYPAVRDKSHYNTLSTNCKLNYKRFINILKFNCETSDMSIDCDSYIESLKTIIEVIKD
jgi:capsular polysaccharide biosynthesis protein